MVEFCKLQTNTKKKKKKQEKKTKEAVSVRHRQDKAMRLVQHIKRK
jgi:hypothetical protein